MRPELGAFKYSTIELSAIAEAEKEEAPWKSEFLLEVKRRIKAFHLVLLKDECCYCRRNVVAEFTMVLDIEHVLPQGQYAQLRYDIRNLSVSCKRCNMQYKKDDCTFLVDKASLGDKYWDSRQYKILHPNIDDYYAHMNRFVLEINDQRIIKYFTKSEKAKETYHYFRLSEFEIDSFDRAQGLNINPDEAVNLRSRMREIEKSL